MEYSLRQKQKTPFEIHMRIFLGFKIHMRIFLGFKIGDPFEKALPLTVRPPFLTERKFHDPLDSNSLKMLGGPKKEVTQILSHLQNVSQLTGLPLVSAVN